jgi:hypothetical protein
MRVHRVLLTVLLVGLGALLGGCPPLVSGSRLYRPVTSSADVFARGRRDVFPGDVRDGHAGAGLVAWSGIVSRVEETATGGTRVWDLYVEHHYWDWIEDFGIQRERAFLSPRGEGPFRCRGVISEGAPTEMTADANHLRVVPTLATGDMAIVVGEPIRVADGVVHLRCLYLDARPKSFYATDRWDYGRRWLLQQDRTDFRILRKP